MIFNRKFLAFSAIAALSVSMSACDDDAGSSSETCAAKCDGTTAITCNADGSEVKKDCASDGMVCKNSQCVSAADAEKCMPGCNDNVLTTCDANGNATTENCGEAKCSKVGDAYQCVEDKTSGAECTDADNKCDGNTLMLCKDGKWVSTACGENQKCNAQTLKCEDESQKCTEDSSECVGNVLKTCVKDQDPVFDDCGAEGNVCNAQTLKCEKPEKVAQIGDPCTCTAESCEKTLTGDKIVNALGATVQGFVKGTGLENDVIKYPDFFSSDIKGCEGIVPPKGMTVGCFRDAKIEYVDFEHSGLNNLLGKISSLLPLIKGFAPNVDIEAYVNKYLPAVKDILGKGIAFTSPGGYCLVATIDVSGTIEGTLATFVSPTVLSKNGGLVDAINTGSHADAKLETSQCPEGSVKFVYETGVNSSSSSMGTVAIDVGFDMCLKSCTVDADCRENDGYKCIDIPNGVPAEGETQQMQKACFDPKNIQAFEEITNDFKKQEDTQA